MYTYWYVLQDRLKNSDLLEAVSSTKLKNDYSWEAVKCTPIYDKH